jgi:hypothetical protein
MDHCFSYVITLSEDGCMKQSLFIAHRLFLHNTSWDNIHKGMYGEMQSNVTVTCRHNDKKPTENGKKQKATLTTYKCTCTVFVGRVK